MSDAPAIRRVVIPDPSLISMAGHHYNYTRAVAEAVRRRGIEATVLCNQSAEDRVVRDVQAMPFFQVATYAGLKMQPDVPGVPLDPIVAHGRLLMHINHYAASEFNHLASFLGPRDLMFIHTVKMTQLVAITQALMSIDEARRPVTSILLRFLVENPLEIALLQMCGATLGDPKMRTRFCTDTVELAALNGNIVRTAIDVVPIPHAPHSRKPGEAARDFIPDLAAGAVVVGYLGNASAGRGFLFRREVIEIVAAGTPRPCHFLMQLGTAEVTPETQKEAWRLHALAGPGLTVVVETLSREDYYDFLGRCDIIVVGYSPDAYRYGSSGVFTEAASAGKVTVIPAGTAMEREARQFGTGFVSFSEFTSAAIGAALRAALADYPALAAKAKAAAEGMVRHHNADNLVDYLLALGARR